MNRPMHPIILRIRAADKARREAGVKHGEWTVDEAADLLGTGRTTVYQLCQLEQIESFNLSAKGKRENFNRRITSNGLIAFVTLNTTGPDEEQLCRNLEEVLRTLSMTALQQLADYATGRMHLISGGTRPAPRVVRKLNLPKPDAQQPLLFGQEEETRSEGVEEKATA